VSAGTETDQQRTVRLHRRALFDTVAEQYHAFRPGYPADLVEFMVDTAGLAAGSTVLEVGCGTGQLTSSLAGFGFGLTAIDIGPSMIATARHHLHDAAVQLQVASFEEFEGAAAETIDLIVSGTAFHWIDPDVKFRKSARLLRPGGWLAVLSTAELYDDPLGSALRAIWSARSPNIAWAKQPPGPDINIAATSGLFDIPVERSHSQRLVVPAQVVVGVENTRATSLSWPEEVRADFTTELRNLLRGNDEVHLTQQTWLVMAQVR